MRSTTREKLKAYAPESVLRLSHWRRDLWSELRLRLLADVGYLLSHRVRKRRLSASRPDFAVHVERPRRAEFYAPERIVAGEHCTIGDSCFLDGRSGLEIGDDVNLGSHVTIYTRQHDVDSPDFAEVGAPVRIGRYAWVASHAIVLPGVTIGEGAVVAAGAVVTKDVEPYVLVGGNPAQPIRSRSRDLRYHLGYAKRFV